MPEWFRSFDDYKYSCILRIRIYLWWSCMRTRSGTVWKPKIMSVLFGCHVGSEMMYCIPAPSCLMEIKIVYIYIATICILIYCILKLSSIPLIRTIYIVKAICFRDNYRAQLFLHILRTNIHPHDHDNKSMRVWFFQPRKGNVHLLIGPALAKIE